MKIVAISDTHGSHIELGQLEGDVLVHCGDLCNPYDPCDGDLEQIDDWFARQNFDHILVIGGNHDSPLQSKAEAGLIPFRNATYLHDQAVEIGGLLFYGTPWLPDLVGWAYYLSEPELIAKWNAIPDQVDVLLTHTPPWRILDRPRSKGRHAGCPHLQVRLEQLRPKLHCFGHIHASHGRETHNGTIYVNAAVVGDSHYEVRHPATEVVLEDRPDVVG